MSISLPVYNFTNIAAAASTLVRTGPGVLHAIAFNKPTATSIITVYDGLTTGGTKIATITVPASPQASGTLYDVAFNTGLLIVMATADSDITVSWAPL